MDRPSPPPLDTIRRVVQNPQMSLFPASWARFLDATLSERDQTIARLEAEVERLGLENMALRAGQHS